MQTIKKITSKPSFFKRLSEKSNFLGKGGKGQTRRVTIVVLYVQKEVKQHFLKQGPTRGEQEKQILLLGWKHEKLNLKTNQLLHKINRLPTVLLLSKLFNFCLFNATQSKIKIRCHFLHVTLADQNFGYCSILLKCGEISIHIIVDGSRNWHKLFDEGQFPASCKMFSAHTLTRY